MKTFAILALIGTISAINIKYNDLPYDDATDKVDPLSRYVGDEDIV